MLLTITSFLLVLACIQQQGYSFSYNRAFSLPRSDKLACSSQYTSRSFLNMEFAWKPAKKQSEDKMAKSLESIQSQFNTLRAGGANAAILDRVFIDYFGSMTPLSQVARVAASGSQQLVVEPFDKTLCKEIEKAIATSGLNLTPNNDGNIIRINIPPLTEERRKELVKQAKSISEEGKVAVRNVRREMVDKIKAAEKDKSISKDDSKDFQDDLQKLTDDYIKKLEGLLKTKEKDLLKI